MIQESTQKVRAEARGHRRNSTFARRTWFLGIGFGICRLHEFVKSLTEINRDTDPTPTLGTKSKFLISMSDVHVTRSLR